MRIAFVGTEIPDHCVEFAEMMAERCDVLLCIPNRFYSSGRNQSTPRLEIDWLPWPRKRSPRNVPFTWTVYRRILHWKPDIVHFLNESNVWNWLLGYLLNARPIVTTVHDVRFHPGDKQSRRVPRVFATALIRQSDAVIVHGEALRTIAVKELPVHAEQVYVMPLVSPQTPSSRSEPVKQPKPNDGVFRVLFFGRIFEYKGLRYLLEAMRLVNQRMKNVRLIIAGQGDDISLYPDLVTGAPYLDVRNRFVPRDEVEQLFVECDLLALPYVEASQSGPLMMAISFGLPVVATDVGEMPSVVRSAAMGLVVPPKDPLALADAICNIGGDAELGRKFAANAKHAAETEYSRDNIGAQVQNIYEDVIKKSRRS
jgi:glycosyltransferase involved in cell wall biosynthesis